MRRLCLIFLLAFALPGCGDDTSDDDDDDDDDDVIVDASPDVDAPDVDAPPVADPCNGCTGDSICVILFGGTCDILSAECVETECTPDTCNETCEAELCLENTICDYSCENEPATEHFSCYGP